MVELIIVTIIIAILATIAIPLFRDAKDTARNVNAVSDIRLLEKSVLAFTIDHGGFYPDILDQVGQGSMHDPWGNPYVFTPNLSVNPAAARVNPIDGKAWNDDFDLYSTGADGQTNIADSSAGVCQDDLIRAGDGGYVGLASSYSY